MGELEEKRRKRARRKNLQQIILTTVAAAGVIGAGMLAPNILIALDKMGALKTRRQKEYIGSAASKMVGKGLLRFNGKFYELTDKGKERLAVWEFNNFRFGKPKKWDRKWRVIIFDIPDKKRKIRDQIRYLFKRAGLYLLQESVWVYPYDCEDIIALLKTDFGIGKNLLYLIVEELENDRHLQNEFDLV